MRYDADWRNSPRRPRQYPGDPGGWDRGPSHPRNDPQWGTGNPRYEERWGRGNGPPPQPESWGYDISADGSPYTPPLYGPARYGLGPYHDRLRRRRRPDDELRRDVEDALFFDTWVDADAITVEVADGIVTLRGELLSYDEVRFATDDAWDIEGVVGVRTELRVT